MKVSQIMLNPPVHSALEEKKWQVYTDYIQNFHAEVHTADEISRARVLIGLAAMVYEPLYHALQIW